jgi:molybdate/tungstate transport system substrate-binding protein
MASIMEGPVKRLAAQRFGVALQGRAQGATGLAQLIAGGGIAPDVFISVTPSPIETVIKAGKVDSALAIARTEMVLAYGPRSPFAARFAADGKPNAPPWWRVLGEDGMRLGRTDPLTDPSGRNAIFVMQLASRLYRQPDLAARILGPDVNPSQIFGEPTIQARLQGGELDAAPIYKIQPTALGQPFVRLPDEINLSDPRREADYAVAAVTLAGKVWHPEPLVYYAAALTDAAHPTEAAAFVKWLGGAEAQAVFHRFGYDPAGNAAELHA